MSLIAHAALAGALAAQPAAETPEPDFRTAFMALLRPMTAHEYAAAREAGPAALAAAQTPMQRYRVRHALTDINARLGDWTAAGDWAREAADTIRGDEGLRSQLMVMASHMAAEEARAAHHLGDAARLAEANARMIADHPDAAPGWRAEGEAGAVHAGGLSCDLLRDSYLRFDLYGGAQGEAECLYWNLSDIGLRVIDGAALDHRVDALRGEQDGFEALDFAWPAAPEGARLESYRWRVGTPREQILVILEDAEAGWTASARFPPAAQDQALEELRAAFSNW